MKNTVSKTKELEKLNSRIIEIRERAKVDIRKAKKRYRFEIADTKGRAKIIDKLLSSKVRSEYGEGRILYYGLKGEDRLSVTRELLNDALEIVATVQSGEYFNMASLRLSKTHYRIKVYVHGSETFSLGGERSEKPTNEVVTEVVKSFFPNVKLVTIK